MAKVVYNACYGGFGLSDLATELGQKLSNDPSWNPDDVPRHDPVLVQVVEKLGKKANTGFSNLQIREILNSARYRIDEYDGLESVMTVNDYTWIVAE